MMTEQTVNIGLIFSGGGSTGRALVAATQEGGTLHEMVKPVVAIATNKHAGIDQMRATGIPVEVLERGKFPKGDEGVELYGNELNNLFEHEEYSDINTLFLLGCLARMSKNVLNKFPDRVANQHPGILDPGRGNDFGGKGMIFEAVPMAHLLYFWATGEDYPFIQATFHHATDRYDEGDIISVREMPLPIFEQNVTITDFRENPELRRHIIASAHDVQDVLKPLEHKNVLSATYSLARTGSFDHIRWPEPIFPPEHAERILEAKQTAIEIYKSL